MGFWSHLRSCLCLMNRPTSLPEQNEHSFFISEIFIASRKCILISVLVSLVFLKISLLEDDNMMWVSSQTNSDYQSKCHTKGVSGTNGNNWVTDSHERNQNINIFFYLTFIIYWEFCVYLTRPLSASNLSFIFLYSQILSPNNFPMSQFCLSELTRNYQVELYLVTFKRKWVGSSWGLWPC